MHMFREQFLSFTANKTKEKVELIKKATGKISAIFVDVTIIALKPQICVLELSNQVLKLVCFKDSEWSLIFL